MKPGMIAAIGVAAALMIGAFMLYATADLMSEMNPDPYDHYVEYVVIGEYEGNPLSGTAVCDTLRENGAFHNYRFNIDAADSEGNPVSQSFTVIFGPDGTPDFFIESDGEYIQEFDGQVTRISVGEMCKVTGFSLESEGLRISAQEVQE